MRILFLSALVSATGCATAATPPVTTSVSTDIKVLNASLGAPPGIGAVTRTTAYESPRTVAQVLRIAPNARIAEHHHPFYDETFVVQAGRISLVLNGKPYNLDAGDFIVIPAGTVISGMNSGDQEARVVVAFSSTGSAGPLSVSGSPHH